jgi:AcrR family transcriptional regulator
MPSSQPVSRRERPAKPALTRAGIAATAFRVMQAEGLERVTMRRLASELDTGPASLYVYVRNASELHGALLDLLLADLGYPAAAGPGEDPRDVLVETLVGYTRVLFSYPSLARSVLILRPAGPHYLTLIDALLRLLRACGVPVTQSAWGVDVLLQLATATAAEQGTREESAEAAPEADAQLAALRQADPARYPAIAEAGDELVSGPALDRLRWAFRALITGISEVPVP